MVLQLGDCTKIIKDLRAGIDFIFIFDHSWWRDTGREDRLNATNVNSGYGGTQQEIQSTRINKEVGFLGLHEKKIEVGEDQHMIFQ